MSGADERDVGIARRRRVPTILQQEAVECGAACLAMILAYNGRWVALEELREACGVGRDGTKATNILKAARSYGLVAKGLSKQIGQLSALPLPLMAFWNFNHFVVVESISPKRIWLNDPAVGPRSVTLKEFGEGFTGVVLAFQRGDGFKPSGRRLGNFEIVRTRMRRSWSGLIFAILAGLALVVPAIAASGYNLIFVNEILIKQNQRWLAPLVLAVVVTALLNGLLNFLKDRSLARLQTAMGAGQSAMQMWRLLHLPLTFFNHRFAGDISNRFSLIDRLAALVSSNIGPSVVAICSILGYGLALAVLDPVLAALVFAFSMASLAVLAASVRGLEDANRRQVSEEAKLQGITIQGLSMVDDFKAAGIEDLFLARWAGAQAKILGSEQMTQFKSKLLSGLSEGLIAMAGVGVLVVGGLRVMDGVLTIGVLVAFQSLMGFFTNSIMSLVSVGEHFQQARGIAERLDDVNRYDSGSAASVYEGSAPTTSGARPSLRSKSLSYGFAPLDPPLIDDLSLTIEPGTRLALVGESGSGKSTLGRLLVGMADPRSGHVEIGDAPLPAWPLAALRRTIAYVDQNVGLFEGTIADNLTLWDKTISEPQIVRAARDAQAHDFISGRPGGYQSRVAEGGANLSGGERQRLAIARALLLDPAILVLDEATSALDPLSELEVMNAVRRRGCSAVIIAHRLSTIRDCDRILVLAKGRVIESGSHEELLARDGAYRRLVEH